MTKQAFIDYTRLNSNPDTIKEICEKFRNSETLPSLFKSYNCSRAVMAHILKDNGINNTEKYCSVCNKKLSRWAKGSNKSTGLYYCRPCRVKIAEKQIKDDRMEKSKENKNGKKCPWCDYVTSGNRSAGMHFKNNHPERNYKDYILFFKNGNYDPPLCKCGCEREVSVKSFWLNIEYLAGHNVKHQVRTVRPISKPEIELGQILFKFMNELGFEGELGPMGEVDVLLETQFTIPCGKRSFRLYDFKVNETNILIEFQGDWFHANPKVYPEVKNEHQQKARDNDVFKAKLAKDNGYDLLTIWEYDFNKKNEIYQQFLQTFKYKVLAALSFTAPGNQSS